MQGTRSNRRNLILKIILPVVLCAIFVAIDQVTKICFANLYYTAGDTVVIDGFFYFTHTINTGAAWSFLAGVSWGQIFFKIITVVALGGFIFLWVMSVKKKSLWLSISFAFIVGGTIGNFIDRLIFDGVRDFIGFIFGSYYFPVFNLADAFLVEGVIMIIVYLLFLDKGKIFKSKKNKKEDIQDGNKEI